MWTKPIVEIRIEEYIRGTLPKYLELYKQLAEPALVRHVGRPLACYVSNVGAINCVTQLWGYDSCADFERGRAAVEQESKWKEFGRAAQGVICRSSSRLTRRVSFPAVDQISSDVHSKPIVDFRVYEMHFGKMETFISTTEAHAMKVQLRHIGPPLGYYRTMVGNLSQITHIWGYDSMADMEKRRETRNADPEWRNYLDASDGIFERQDTQILRRLNLFS